MSDLEEFGAGFGLDRPGAAGAEAGRGGVAVLEELQIGHLPVDDLRQDRERGADYLAQRLRLVAEVTEHRDVLAGSEHRSHVERLVFPAGEHLAEIAEERLRAVGGAGPRHDLAELGVLRVKRDVDGVGGDQAVDDIGIQQVLQPLADDLDRAGRHVILLLRYGADQPWNGGMAWTTVLASWKSLIA